MENLCGNPARIRPPGTANPADPAVETLRGTPFFPPKAISSIRRARKPCGKPPAKPPGIPAFYETSNFAPRIVKQQSFPALPRVFQSLPRPQALVENEAARILRGGVPERLSRRTRPCGRVWRKGAKEGRFSLAFPKASEEKLSSRRRGISPPTPLRSCPGKDSGVPRLGFLSIPNKICRSFPKKSQPLRILLLNLSYPSLFSSLSLSRARKEETAPPLCGVESKPRIFYHVQGE